MKFTFVAAAMHTFLHSHCTDVGVYPADDVYSIAKIMKTLIEIYPIFTGDTAVFSFLHEFDCHGRVSLLCFYIPYINQITHVNSFHDDMCIHVTVCLF